MIGTASTVGDLRRLTRIIPIFLEHQASAGQRLDGRALANTLVLREHFGGTSISTLILMIYRSGPQRSDSTTLLALGTEGVEVVTGEAVLLSNHLARIPPAEAGLA